MGAQVDGIGSNVMTVHGRDKLGGAEHTICARPHRGRQLHGAGRRDRRRAADPRRRARRPDDDPAPVPPPRPAVEDRGRRRARPAGAAARRSRSDLGDAIPKIEDGPWPAFPADLTSIALALATQAEGEILIFEKMFENRLFFVDKLVAMGARITLCDPHRAIVSGPSRLHGERVESPDIRAGMAMLIAALAAEGTSEIGNIRQIDRGYEQIDERLRGARRPDRAGLRRGPCLAGLSRPLS